WQFHDITRDLTWMVSPWHNATQVAAKFVGRHHGLDKYEPTVEETERYALYKEFSGHWSRERQRNRCPLLAIFVAAVVDQQPLSVIAQDHGLSVLQIKRLLIRGLRDYVRRAGWK